MLPPLPAHPGLSSPRSLSPQGGGRRRPARRDKLSQAPSTHCPNVLLNRCSLRTGRAGESGACRLRRAAHGDLRLLCCKGGLPPELLSVGETSQAALPTPLFAPCEIASAHGLSFCAHSRDRQRGNRGNRSAAVVSRPARTCGSNETDLGGERGHLRFLIMARCSRCDPAKLVTSVQLALRSASFHSLNARTSYEKKGPRFRWT